VLQVKSGTVPSRAGSGWIRASAHAGAVSVLIEKMNYYGAKDLASSFRTVRKNTLQIAEEIPEDKYGFQPAPGTRTVARTLVHIASAQLEAGAGHGQQNLSATVRMYQFVGRVLAAIVHVRGDRKELVRSTS
jgi:DinB superfamily